MKHLYAIIFLLGFLSTSNAQIINFPDANFKTKLLESSPQGFIAKNLSGQYFDIDVNNNNEIEVSEALQVSYLDVRGYSDGTLGSNYIQSVVGIEYFTNLIDFDCAFNQITDLDVSSLINLEILRCDSNRLTNLNIDGLLNLTSLAYGNNNVPIFNNYLPNLNLSQFVNLKELYCGNSNLTDLDLTPLVNLEILVCYYNQITDLNFSTCNNMYAIFCQDNQIENLDLSNLRNLIPLHLDQNPNLKQVLLKTGRTFIYNDFANISFSDCPNLEYLCVDEVNAVGFQNKIAGYGYTNCNLNSYCSFTPGGTYYSIHGNSKLDSNNNGCDSNDLALPNLNLTISNGTNTGSFISNGSGNYSIPVQAGTQTITPVLENPTYYTISPTSFSAIFPTQTSPFVQNFCITPNGSHQDVETWIIPLTPARPGFDSRYKIMYKNKGNTTVSGNLVFAFDDDYMDFISATSLQSSQSFSLLNWNYSNLLPFETRAIEVKFNINSPMETPAVNIGDLLKFSSTIFPLTGDEYSSDNSNGLNQIVVGSLDPNDKTCVEGNFIEPEMIGQYVHYVIRFENTGTFAAENIVVKDMIDETKFDISTLLPLDASHDFKTRITGSKVEFLFENINLPFDDENNDGYVAFKIKTKSTLTLGNTFSNTANIYFDYNFPIVTNTASTTIQRLANQDFEFSANFTLYPNPVKDILHIKATNVLSLYSVSIYNPLGQVLQVITNPTEEINVTELKTGNYFIKVITDKGTSSSRFVKI